MYRKSLKFLIVIIIYNEIRYWSNISIVIDFLPTCEIKDHNCILEGDLLFNIKLNSRRLKGNDTEENNKNANFLSISYTLLEKLTEIQGGKIYSSTEDQNKTIELRIPSKFFILPISQTTDIPIRRASDSIISFPKNLIPTSYPQETKRPSILLVEDSVPIQKLMTRLLKNNQCEVDVAENGQVGLSKLEISTYDIVLVDFEMPVMTGPEMLRQFVNSKFYNKGTFIIGTKLVHIIPYHQKNMILKTFTCILFKEFPPQQLK